MKKQDSKSQQILLYVILFSLIFIAFAYIFGYKKFNDKAEALRKSNSELSVRVAELKTYYDNADTYDGQKTFYSEKIKDSLKDYPANVREEDMIMLAVDTLDGNDIEYKNVNMPVPEAYYTIDNSVSKPTLESVGLDNLEDQIIFAKHMATYVNKLDYPSLKNMVTTINAYKNRSTITNIEYAVIDSDDYYIEGTVDVAFYYISGDGKAYTPVDIEEYKKGLENLFGLKEKKPEEEEGAKAPGENAEGEGDA